MTNFAEQALTYLSRLNPLAGYSRAGGNPERRYFMMAYSWQPTSGFPLTRE